MRRNQINRLSESATHNLPKVFAAFTLAMIGTFTGALMYSQSQQNEAPTAVRVARSAQPTQSPVLTAAAILGQSSPTNSTQVDEQQSPIPARSRQLSKPETRGPNQSLAERVQPLASVELGRAMRSEPVQKYLPQTPISTSHPIYQSAERSNYSNLQETSPVLQSTEAPLVASTQPGPTARREFGASSVAQPSNTSATPSQTLPSIPPQPAPTVVTVQAGTGLEVRLLDTVSSDRNRTGHIFRAELASPLIVNGYVVAGTGSMVLGRVANARKAPLIGGRANLTLTLTNITTADGRLVKIDTNNIEREGSRSGIVNTAKMATGAAVGAVIGAVTGAEEGAGISSSVKNSDTTNGFMATNRTIVLSPGTQATFTVASPLRVTAQPNR